MLPPAEFAALTRSATAGSALDAGRVYFPYFSIDTVFETPSRARGWSRRDPASPLRDYLERLLDFATRSRWGKRPIARGDASLAERADGRQVPPPGGFATRCGCRPPAERGWSQT